MEVEPVKTASLEPLLHRADIFGVDLYQAGLAETVLSYFEKLTAGKGSVRKVLNTL